MSDDFTFGAWKSPFGGASSPDSSPVSASSSTFGINVTFDQNVNTLPAGFVTDVDAVVAYFQSIFSDTVNINLHVGFGEYDGMPMDSDDDGHSYGTFHSYTYSQIRTALANDSKDGWDSHAVASLPTTDPLAGTGTYAYDMMDSEAQALGLRSTSTPTDVYIGISSTTTFDYDRSDGITAGDADFIGVVAHELTEDLGRELAEGAAVFNGSTTPIYYLADLFHFSSQNNRDFNNVGGYVSDDNGVTDLGNLNPSTNGDPGDLATTTPPNSFDAFDTYGTYNDVTPNDLAWMSILGMDWNGDDYGSDTNFSGEVTAVPIGSETNGYLVSGNINFTGDHDWFRVKLTAGQSYRIDLNAGGPLGSLQDSQLRLFNSSSDLLATDSGRHEGGSGTADYSSRLFFTPTTTGYYYVDAAALNEGYTGTYTVGVVPDDYDASVDTTGAVAIDGSATGNIETVLDSDWFKVNLTAGRTYVLRMAGAGQNLGTLGDSTLSILQASGAFVATTHDFNGAQGSNIIYRTVTSGTYYFDASSYNDDTVGSYTVSAYLRVSNDLSADGTSDILFRNNATGDAGFYQISNGANTGWHDVGASSTAYSVAGVGDFNADGVADILFRNNANGDTGFYQMNYTGGTLQGWHDVGASSTAYSVVGVGDFNDDGTSDILYRNNANGDTGFYAIVNGANTGWNDVGASSTAYSVAGVGDFNGDGISDILFRNNATGDTGFYQLNFRGENIGWHDVGASSTGYSVVGVGDFNGDGTSDVLFRNNTNGDTGFYAIVNGVNTGWHDVGTSSTAYSVVAVGDYNSDGTSDILFRNNTNGDTGFYAIVNGVNAGWHDVGASSTAYHVAA